MAPQPLRLPHDLPCVILEALGAVALTATGARPRAFLVRLAIAGCTHAGAVACGLAHSAHRSEYHAALATRRMIPSERRNSASHGLSAMSSAVVANSRPANITARGSSACHFIARLPSAPRTA